MAKKPNSERSERVRRKDRAQKLKQVQRRISERAAEATRRRGRGRA